MEHPELILFFFCVATIYSAVGFGGGSSYAALLALYSLDVNLIKFLALLCNIIVVSGGVYWFSKKGHLKWKKIWPLIILSIPLSFIGGRIMLSESTFFITLALALIIASLFVFIKKPKSYNIKTTNSGMGTNTFIGGGIGFLSGLVGIGGGIFLAPILHLMNWDLPKKIAAAASLFILVNSIAGICGQLSKGYLFHLDYSLFLSLALAVLIGGQIGSSLGSGFFKADTVKKLTALLIFLVGIRILIKYI